ncbi:MAG: S8 family serine peptidase, partial [Anaerolineae bacterium]
MRKLHRLAGMILLFWLLANAVWASHLPAAPDTRSPDLALTPRDEEFGLQTSLAEITPSWYANVAARTTREADGPWPIEPDLQRVLEDADDDEVIRVIVQMRARAATGGIVLGTLSDVEARAELVGALQTTATQSQAPLRAFLDEQRSAGQVASYEPLWITNAIAVRAAPSVVRILAAQPSVAAVRLDHWRRWITDGTPDHAVSSIERAPSRIPDASGVEPFSRRGALNPQYRAGSAQSVEWNISRVRADEVWHSLLISGTGALVAGMDTGVDWFHPALRDNYRGYNPHGPSNHIYSWYDATDQGALYPVDGHGHGSHTLGTIVGQGGIGVAPGARWIG